MALHEDITADSQLHKPYGFANAPVNSVPVKMPIGRGSTQEWFVRERLPKAIDIASSIVSPPTANGQDIYLLNNASGFLDVDTVVWQSGTTVRITFNGTPDLSGYVIGDYLHITGSTNESNNGTYLISDVNDGADYVEITNPSRTDATDDEASDAVGVATITDADWTGAAPNSWVRFNGVKWIAIEPTTGFLCYLTTPNSDFRFNGTDWIDPITAHDGNGIFAASNNGASIPSGFGAVISDTLAFTGGRFGIGGTPVSSALLDLQSTTHGLLQPRMTTTERDNIVSPATGLSIYNITTGQFEYYNGASWLAIGAADGNGIYGGNGTVPTATAVTLTDTINFDSDTFVIDGTNDRVGIGIASPTQKLHVVGNGLFEGGAASRVDLTNGANSRAKLEISGTGDYGQVVISDSANTSQVIFRGGGTSPTAEFRNGNDVIIYDTANVQQVILRSRISASEFLSGFGIKTRASANNGYFLYNTSGSERGQMAISGSDYGQITLRNTSSVQTIIMRATGNVTFDTGGNFGIGTAVPTVKLDVQSSATNIARFSGSLGSHTFSSSATSGYDSKFELTDSALEITHNTTIRDIYIHGGVGTGITVRGNSGKVGVNNQTPVAWLTVSGDGVEQTFNAGINHLMVDKNANVGIGTATQFGTGGGVIGIANATTVPTTNPTGGGVLWSEGGLPKWRDTAGNVYTLTDTGAGADGNGIYSGSGSLVANTSVTTGAFNLNVDTSTGFVGGGTLSVRNAVGGLAMDIVSGGSSVTNNLRLGDSQKYYLAAGSNGLFFTNGAGTTTTMVMTQANNVGIGTTSPAALQKLDVVGNLKVSWGIGVLGESGENNVGLRVPANRIAIAFGNTGGGGATIYETANNLIIQNRGGAGQLIKFRLGNNDVADFSQGAFPGPTIWTLRAMGATALLTDRFTKMDFVSNYWDGASQVKTASIEHHTINTSGDSEIEVNIAGATMLKVDESSTAGDTRFFIYDVDNGTLERVTVGAADSGGTGFKVLRIPN